ncbi:hypothetical protein [Sphingorhabdus lacus]|uniref:Uncharacterized protein n=1 Tax=Sphingorhabdus lacus TaxID=392610 RepID=A0A6I6L7U4_9SPHN|nr:hypothetical protein [Sphingorhabdus lacus]QGY80804.1 hypothetical protein EUU25_09340 [Sphingorhabdus lacus]
MKMHDGALIVFTAKTVDAILEAGGTQSWVLNPSSMNHVKYVVCTRNADRKYDEECGVRPEPHRSAFLVGKVSGIRKVDNRNDRDRYIILFSEYAEVSIPEFRGMERNPVTYSDTSAMKSMGLDIAKLVFKPMPKSTEGLANVSEPEAKNNDAGFNIAEAKKGLAIYFGVPVESIQITISG